MRSKEGDVLHDMSHMYALKSAIEDLLGNCAWLELKESTSTTTWRRYGLKLVNAIELSIETTIKIKDEDWSAEVHSNLEHGRELMRLAKSPEDVIAALSATLLRQVFLQMGYSPSRKISNSVSLKADNWKFDGFRTVQIVQTVEQRENLFRFKQRKTIGFDAQFDLEAKYRASKSMLPYSQWCAESGA
jgi:hypothetical protein